MHRIFLSGGCVAEVARISLKDGHRLCLAEQTTGLARQAMVYEVKK